MKKQKEEFESKIAEIVAKQTEQPQGLKAEDLEALKAELAAAQAQVQEKLGSLDSEINALKESGAAKETGEGQDPTKAAAAENAVSDAETMQKLADLEKKTKGGFGKVKEDMKKQKEEFEKRLSEIQPG